MPINKIVNGKMFGQLFLLNEEILEDNLCNYVSSLQNLQYQSLDLFNRNAKTFSDTHTQLDYYNPLPMLGVNKGKSKV